MATTPKSFLNHVYDRLADPNEDPWFKTYLKSKVNYDREQRDYSNYLDLLVKSMNPDRKSVLLMMKSRATPALDSHYSPTISDLAEEPPEGLDGADLQEEKLKISRKSYNYYCIERIELYRKMWQGSVASNPFLLNPYAVLFKPNINEVELQKNLGVLYQYLYSFPYDAKRFRYYTSSLGGNYSQPIKIPKHIQKMMEYYENNIATKPAQEIRNELFRIARQAAENPPRYFGLFNLRSSRVQALYDEMKAQPQQTEPLDGQLPRTRWLLLQ